MDSDCHSSQSTPLLAVEQGELSPLPPLSHPDLLPSNPQPESFPAEDLDDVPRDMQRSGSSLSGFFNFVKAMFGAGILSLPAAFQKTGFALGLVLYTIMAALCAYSMLILIKSKRHSEKRCPTVRTYGDVGGYAFGPFGKHMVGFIVVLLPIFFCSGFIIVINENLMSLLPAWWKEWYIPVLMFPLFGSLSMIHYFKNFGIFSFIGLAVYLVGVMGSVYFHILFGEGESQVVREHQTVWLAKWEGSAQFVGPALYSLEGILLVLPVENSLLKPKSVYGVILGGMVAVYLIFASFGAIGYSAGYGECEIVTKCLPPGAATTCVKVALSIALMLTCPVTAFCAFEMVESEFLKENGTMATEVFRRLLRLLMVGVMVIIAACVKRFDLFSELIGGVFIVQAGFVIPPILYLKLFGMRLSIPTICLNILMVVVGCFLSVYNGYSAIKDIVNFYSGHHQG